MVIKTKAIEMRDIVNFCDNYNAIGYGEARIIELINKFIITFYNAGYSLNELKDSDFKDLFEQNLIYNRHPIHIYEFSKLRLQYGNYLTNFGNLKDWCNCYEKQDVFTYMVEIE